MKERYKSAGSRDDKLPRMLQARCCAMACGASNDIAQYPGTRRGAQGCRMMA